MGELLKNQEQFITIRLSKVMKLVSMKLKKIYY